MTERRYSDEEVALILREASEVQEGGRRAGTESGLTLAQLKEIAGEVGLDPSSVESAALRLIHHRAGGKVPFFGTPVTPEFEREILGKLDEDDLAELVTTIRKVLGRRGVTGTELGTFEWKAADPVGARYVSLNEREGKTRLRVFANFRDGLGTWALGGGMMVTMAFTALMAALGLKEVLGPGILAVGALLAVLPVRTLWRLQYRKEENALADLTETLDAQIRALIARKEGGAGTQEITGGTAPQLAPPSPEPDPR